MITYDPALAFYIIALLFLLIQYYTDKSTFKRIYVACMVIGVLLNTIHIAHMALYTPFYFIRSLFMLLSSTLAVICLIFSIKDRKSFIGLIILPVVIVSGLLTMLFTGSSVKSKAMESMWLYLHIPLSVIGIAFFMTAFAAGVMYFILGKQLKEKKSWRIFMRFPSLISSDVLNNLSLGLGFAFYSAGMFAAIAWTVLRFDSLEPLTDIFYIKIIASTAVWLIAGAIILIKKLFPVTIRRMAFISVAGFTSTSVMLAAVVLAMLRI